ncbi:MAG: hypothetical protein ACR2P0_19590 [Acidimicrobiales bacterium]
MNSEAADSSTEPGEGDESEPNPIEIDPTGLVVAEPISDDERAELDFLRYESAHLQARVRDLEQQVKDTARERDTIQHERNLMAQDFQWTLGRLDSSPLAPVLRRMEGYKRLRTKWGAGPE